jgi:hypothetical protein
MAVPNSSQRYGPEVYERPNPMFSSLQSSKRRDQSKLSYLSTGSAKRPGRSRTSSQNQYRGPASVKKRPAWLHPAIDFKRDPFTSGYSYSFKDRTTSVLREARAWSDAAHRIDEQQRRTLEKKRVRQRHLATFQAMQRASYGNEFDDDLTMYGVTPSSIQYVPATRTGIPVASRIATSSARKDVSNLIGELRSRQPPPSSAIYTPGGGRSNSGNVNANTDLRFSDLHKQQKQQKLQQDEDTDSDETMRQLAEARQRLDAIHTLDDKGGEVRESERCVSFKDDNMAKELDRLKSSLKAAETRVEQEMTQRIEMEAKHKALLSQQELGGVTDEASNEKALLKDHFNTLLTELEKKYAKEKEKAKTTESKLNEQITDLIKRLEDSEKQISALTKANREKERNFNGVETA